MIKNQCSKLDIPPGVSERGWGLAEDAHNLRSFFMYPKWRTTHLDFRQGCSGTVETGFPF